MQPNHCLHCVFYYGHKANKALSKSYIANCLFLAKTYLQAAHGFITL